MLLQPGDTFGRYRIDVLLGAGGMGVVYRAFDTRLERRVALKVLLSGGEAALGDSTPRVLREARAAASLNHPNAITIHDLGEQDGIPYFAMELVVGGSLRSYVGASEPSDMVRLAWLVDVARVLDHAHRTGLVHRDIKPENVMVRDDGVIKVLDFGIARRTPAIDPTGATATPGAPHSTLGVAVGTPAYMAPEQVRGEPLDGRADQFAWGVLAYELLGGRLPWSARDVVATIAAVVSEEAAPLATVRPELAGTTSEVVARAMAKNPRDRFASMAELLAALGAAPATVTTGPIAASHAELVSAPTVVAPPRAPPRRRWALGAAVGLVLAAGGALGVRSFRTASRAVPLEAPVSRGIAVTDLPDPKGCNPAATPPYRRALADLRSRGWGDAYAHLREASRADPACPLVAARYAYLGSQMGLREEVARVPYQTATRGRDALEPRDRDVLDALSFVLAEEPPNLPRFAERIKALSDRYPQDAELMQYGAYLDIGAPDAQARAERGTALDPLSADAWQTVAAVRFAQGDDAGARAALEECIRVAPASTDCRLEQVFHASRLGHCAEAARHARSWVGFDPDTGASYYFYANALASDGASPAAVFEALGKRERTLPPDQRPTAARELAHFHVLQGDFAAARATIERFGDAARDELDAAPHGRYARVAVELAVEEGRDDDAADLAMSYLDRSRAWIPPLTLDFKQTGWYEAEPILLDVAARTGRITRAEWERRAAAWTDAIARPPLLRWTLGRAIGVGDADEARAAVAAIDAQELEARSKRPRLGSGVTGATVLGIAGRTLALADRTDLALVYLRLATTDCMPLQDPLHQTRAFAWYGEALEAKGKKSEACEAYGTVLSRWGKVTTRSITAEAVRKRSEALACP